MKDKEKEKELEKCHCDECHCEEDKEKCECTCEGETCDCEEETCNCEDCSCEDEECECGEDHEHEHHHEHGEACEHEHHHEHGEACEHDHHHEQEHDPRYEYIVALEKDLKDAEEKVLRAKADMINYRKRMEEEQLKVYKYINGEMVKKILPIVDNFDRAIALDDANLTDELSKFLSGFKMIHSDLEKILKDNDVTVIDALNQKFDPMYHEAVATEKVDGKEPGMVTVVLQKGYMLKDKVIRPAMVKVSE